MKATQQNQNEGKLGNRTAHLTEGSGKKWLLYLPKEKNPLLGIVHANTREETLERVAAIKLSVMAVPAEEPEVEVMTSEKITRQFELFHTVIPSATDDPARHRTTWFYRQTRSDQLPALILRRMESASAALEFQIGSLSLAGRLRAVPQAGPAMNAFFAVERRHAIGSRSNGLA